MKRAKQGVWELRYVLWALGLACHFPAPSHGQTAAAVSPTAAVREDALERGQAELRRQAEREAAQAGELQKGVEVRGAATSSASAQRLPRQESPCFPLHGIQIAGVAPGQFPWLMDSLAGVDGTDSPLRRCVGAQGVGLLLRRAQDAVLAHGFVTTRVLAPPQDLSEGTLDLQVIPGRIHAVRFDPKPDGRKAPAGLIALPMQPGDVLNLRDIEQALENLQRVPTVQADIQIVPAGTDAPDQSDLLIAWQQEQAARLTLSLDDIGSTGTGRLQGSTTLSLDNPLGLSDLAYVTLSHDLNQELGSALANTAEGARGTRGHTAHYSLPMGYWLLGATYSSSRYYQNVAGIYQSYVYSGTSENSDIRLSRVIFRDAVRKSTLALKAWQRRSNNYIDDTEVRDQRRVKEGAAQDQRSLPAHLMPRIFICGAVFLIPSLAIRTLEDCPA